MGKQPVTLYHNPRCTKSREALRRLQEAGYEPAVIEYLKDSPTAEDLKALLRKLAIPAHDLLRTKEPAYESAHLSPDSTEAQIIKAIVANPILLERPIVVNGPRAVIARPTDRIDELL